MYPCEGCLVDVMCIDPCDELIFFSDDLNTTNIPYEILKTSVRLARMNCCVLKYASGGWNRRAKLNFKLTEMWNNPPGYNFWKND